MEKMEEKKIVESTTGGIIRILLMSWFNNMNNESKLSKDKILESSFLAKVLAKKIEAMGLDVIVPNELLSIIILCSETPAEVQMIFTDILDGVLEANKIDKLPKEYKITPFDFIYTYPDKFPITCLYPDVKERYNKKWDDQKINGMNSYDTYEFWEKYR